MAAYFHVFFSLITTTTLLAVLLFNLADGAAECKASERKSLLSFKAGVGDPKGLLQSWVEGTDCCRWLGIACNTTTGVVTSIDLSNRGRLNGTANMVALFSLSNLQHLDLSWNDFDSAVLLPKIGSLTNLAYLDLSNAGFRGKIPAQLGNLTRLTTLHLSNIYRPSDRETELRGFLETDNVNWLRSLEALRSLSLDGVDLSGAGKEWDSAVSSLRQLARLSMAECALFPILPTESDSFRNLSASLRYLDLSGNGDRDFPAEMPAWLQNFTALQTLDLSLCALSGNVFPIRNLPLRKLDLFANNLNGDVSSIFFNQSLLSWLSLEDNKFEGTIPLNISSPALTHLDLSSNNFEGSLPQSIARLVKLQHLIIRNNYFGGQIPISLSQLSYLSFVDLGVNRFSGGIPSNMGDLSNLKYLDLSANQLNGSIPPRFAGISGLEHLDLSFNQFTGVFKLELLENLTGLQFLLLSNNKLTLNFSPTWNPTFRLQDLGLSGCNIRGIIPPFLSQQLNLQAMDLSYNNLTGNVPSWLWELPRLRQLNLSGNHLEGHLPGYLFPKRDESYVVEYIIDFHSNNLQGALPLLPSTVEYIDLSDNNFNGSIPSLVGISLITLILSGNNLSGALSSSICSPDIRFLDLSSNKLSGCLPSCLTNCSILGVFNITSNDFDGEIPQDIGNMTSLEVLHMNGNKLRGSLPSSLRYCKMLKILDLGNNMIEGNIPNWIKDLQQLRIVNLRSNKLRGMIPSEILQLQSLQILDLSKNNLSGELPTNFSGLQTMINQTTHAYLIGYTYYIANLFFENVIDLFNKGQQMQYQKLLSIFTLIDLSDNQLTGKIPEELRVLKALISLNISRNNLTGEMPGSIGDMQELESLDLSHNLLIGPIPDSLGNLNALGYLELSYNNLSGRIPQVRHLDTFSGLSYIGNAWLCGAPLNITCGTSASPFQPSEEVEDEEEDDTWWAVAIGLCYGLGVALVVGVLSFDRERRRLYFQFLDNLIHRLCEKVRTR